MNRKAPSSSRTKSRLDGIHAQCGMVPNLVRTMADAPAQLEPYMSTYAALSGGFLSVKLREQIALVVAETNGCDYCVAAHSEIGQRIGLSEGEIADGHRATSTHRKTELALQFARELVENHGRVDAVVVLRLRRAGYREEAVVDIIANVALNVFANYFNHVAQTAADLLELSDLGQS